MANISLKAINKTTQDSTDINPDSDASTGLKISTWTAPAGSEAYVLQVGAAPTVTGGASSSYSIYTEGPMAFKDNLGKIILSTVGTTSSSSYTLSLPRQTATLATLDDVIAARNGLDVHDSARVATTEELPWTEVLNYAGQTILSAGAPSTVSTWDTATTAISPTPKPFVFAQRMNHGKSGSGLKIVINAVEINTGRITAASLASGNYGTQYKGGSMSTSVGDYLLTGSIGSFGSGSSGIFGTVAVPLTAVNGTQWIVAVTSSPSGVYSGTAYALLNGYIVPAGVGDFMNPGVNRAGNDAGYSVTIKGSSLGGTDTTNDLTFYPQYQPSIIRVDPVASGTPAYFLVKETYTGSTSGVVASIQLIHGGSGFTSGSALWATTNINGHLAAHKTGVNDTNTVLGMTVATDPSAIRRVWFIKDTFSSSSQAVLGTPYYPKTSNGYGMYVNYTTNSSGIVTNISLVNAGSGYLTNDLVHTSGVPQPIQYGLPTGKMNFSLDMPEGRGVTGWIYITDGVPGISTTIAVTTGNGTAGTNVSTGVGSKTFSNVPCTIVSGTGATAGDSNGKFTVHTTASGATYTDSNTKIVVVVPPSGAAANGTTTIKILGTDLGTSNVSGDLTFTYTKAVSSTITVLTGGPGLTPNTTTTTPVSISPGTDLPMMWYLPSPDNNTSYHTIVECAVSPWVSSDIYFEGATAVWKNASTIDPFVLSSRTVFPGSGLQLVATSTTSVSIVPGGNGDWYQIGDKIYVHPNATGTYVTVTGIEDFRAIGKGPATSITRTGAVDVALRPFNTPFLTNDNANNTGSSTIPISIPSAYTSSVSIISTVSGFRSYYFSAPASVGITKSVTADGGHYFHIALHNDTPSNFAPKTTWTWTSPEGLNTSTGFSERPTATLSGFIKPYGPPSFLVDGVTVQENNRMLIKNQTTASTNGIYVPTYAKLNPYVFQYARAVDFNSDIASMLGSQVIPAEVSPNAFVFVEEGTVNKDSGWTCTTDAPIFLGSSAITWAKFTGASGVSEDQPIVGWTGAHTFSKWIDANTPSTNTYFGNISNWIRPERVSGSYLELHSDSVLKLSANTADATTRLNLGNSFLESIQRSGDASGFEMKFIKSRGSVAATPYAAVNVDDVLGKLSFHAYTGSNANDLLETASIVATASSSASTGQLSFFTTGVSRLERFRIADDGKATIYGTGTVNPTLTLQATAASGTADLLTNITTGSANIFPSVKANSDGIKIGGSGVQVSIGNSTGAVSGENASLLIKGYASAAVKTNALIAYLFDETATTIRMGAAAAAITMGDSTGTVTINNPTVTMTNGGTFNMNGLNQLIETTGVGTASIFNGASLTTGNLFGKTTAITIGSGKIPGTTLTPQSVAIGASSLNVAPTSQLISAGNSGTGANLWYGYTAVYADTSESIVVPMSNTVANNTSTASIKLILPNAASAAVGYNFYRKTSNNYLAPWLKLNLTPQVFTNTPTTALTVSITATSGTGITAATGVTQGAGYLGGQNGTLYFTVTTTGTPALLSVAVTNGNTGAITVVSGGSNYAITTVGGSVPTIAYLGFFTDTNNPTTAGSLPVSALAQHSSVIGQSSYQLGFSANASSTRGRFSLASGGFAANATPTVPIAGSSQMSTYVLSAYTNALNQTVTMTTDWVGTDGSLPSVYNQIIIKENSTYAFSILISISAGTSTAQTLMGSYGATIITEGVISRATGGVATIQGGSVISRCQSNLFAPLACTAATAPYISLVEETSTTTGVFQIKANANTTGSTACSLRWTAVVTMSECG